MYVNVEWCECNVKAYELVLLLEHVRAKECWLLLFITTTTLFTMFIIPPPPRNIQYTAQIEQAATSLVCHRRPLSKSMEEELCREVSQNNINLCKKVGGAGIYLVNFLGTCSDVGEGAEEFTVRT